MTDFTLDPRLQADCIPVGDFPLSRVLLFNDRRYPWVILVPRRQGVREIYQLDAADRRQLVNESCELGEWMMTHFGGEKLNVGALGNIVAQLHVHHVVRSKDDPAWPGPVWGHSAADRYESAVSAARIEALRSALGVSVGAA